GVFADEGFHSIVGNPPYLFITELDDIEKQYFSAAYKTFSYRYDIYGLFIEKSFRNLLRPKGKLGLIIPHTLLNNDSFEKLRSYILDETTIDGIIDIGPGVFFGARNETMIILGENRMVAEEDKSSIVKSDKSLSNLEQTVEIHQSIFRK